jgi:Holliday junction resolvasome RuvABC DNA-binding subunit
MFYHWLLTLTCIAGTIYSLIPKQCDSIINNITSRIKKRFDDLPELAGAEFADYQTAPHKNVIDITYTDALAALIKLGYTKVRSEKALHTVMLQSPGMDAATIIKLTLQII